MTFLSLSIFIAQYVPTQGAPLGISMTYWIIMGGSMLASLIASNVLKRRFQRFSQIPTHLNGAQAAQKMLSDNGITDVEIISTSGQLTDHYNPRNKTVNLSESVYAQNNVAAIAVAAHEVGHALQHAQSYSWLTMRSTLVPAANVGSNLAPFLIMAGFLLQVLSPSLGSTALLFGIILFAASTLFAVVTLPVEFDASNRALAWINQAGVMASMEQSKAKSALNAAAMTYVVAALTSLAHLVHYIMIYLNQRN